MEQQRLVDMLRQLHAELSKADGADPETLSLLQALTDDIHRVLGKGQRDEQDSSEEAQPAANGLHDLLLRFEAEHPELATTIGKIADGLAAMGI